MTKKQIKKVLALYDQRLKSLKCECEEYPNKRSGIGDYQYYRLSHCRWMINQIKEMIKEDKMEKVYRWLGFIQGCLWNSGIFTIKEMKKHNKA